MLVVLAQAGLAGLDDVHAQRSCDSVSVGCSEDSNGAAENRDDDGDNDNDSEGNSAGIESKIPSTVGIGVPFP
jgi:hypothetical protein